MRWVLTTAMVMGALAASPKPAPPKAGAPSAPKPAPLSAAGRKALEARETGRVEESIRLFEPVLRQSPGMVEGWWYQGLNYYDLDRYPECEDAFTRVVKLEDKNAGAWAFLGLCTARTGAHERAFAQLVRAQQLGLEPLSELDKVVRLNYTMLAIKIGQFEYATTLLSDTARLFPETPMLTEMSGLASLRMARLPPEIKPEEREPVQLAGAAAIKAWQRVPLEGMPALEELLAKYPGFPNVHYLAGWMLLQIQDPRALDEFRKEIARDPKHLQARLQIAHECFLRGDLDEGLDYARQALQLAPDDFATRNILGRLFLKAGNSKEALTHLQTAVKLAPRSAESHFALATAYQKEGRKMEADKHRRIFRELEEARAKEAVTAVRPLNP